MKRVTTKAELIQVAQELGVRTDWHEPDEQEVTTTTHGTSFDNAGFWGDGRSRYRSYEEQHIVLYKEGRAVAVVNLATLFAWATGLEDPGKQARVTSVRIMEEEEWS
jgi:hypothetical protein